MIGAYKGDSRLMGTALINAPITLLLISFSFFTLMYAYVTSDFSVKNVWENSHSLQPILYRATGTWGNHEGSMLLWVLILAIFAGLVALFGKSLPLKLRANVLGVQAWVLALFLLFILLTSNPFERLVNVPFEGEDLNPILQDIGLAIHPPLLYVGYVGFSLTFAFAVAALIDGKLDAAWARWVRPWTLLAWVFLTAGIAMGSYWAYYELGWGGWWFWDPVENASFMPWLSGTALLHSALVMEKRSALKIWTVLLAIITFSLSLLGTFLVRSGVLTSVHAFATDPERGLFILAILVFFIGGSLFLFALRSNQLQAGGIFAPISREGALVFNNLMLTTATISVLSGTLYPLILEALTGDKISVGAPYFNPTFGLLMLPVILVMPLGPLLAWKRGDIVGVFQRVFALSLFVICATAIAYGFLYDGPWLAPLGLGLAIWAMVGAFAELQLRAGFFNVPLGKAVQRLFKLPGSMWGTAFAHFGLGVTLLGIVSVTAYEQENIVVMKPGQQAEISGYTIVYKGNVPRQYANYISEDSRFDILRGGNVITEMAPSKRFYTTRKSPTSESAIYHAGFSQLYIALGEREDQGGMIVRIWWKPLISLIWIGTIFMVLGGCFSLVDRRYRYAVPKLAKQKKEDITDAKD
jgi:cytochrome c-type biogenesis protein CcmF